MRNAIVPDALIESAIDGDPVDWEVVEASAADGEQRQLLGHLQVVASISALHRGQLEGHDESGGSQPRPATTVQLLTKATSSRVADRPRERWGHFELLERVGEGSFGEVYRARDTKLDREVAIKLLKFRGVTDASVTDRVLREARALARVRHPNVVTVYSVEEHDTRIGLCMEFVRGQTLEDVLDEHGSMSAEEASHIGQEICRALAAVHAVGLLHRDIKTGNVMRAEGGRVVLMDFGAGTLASVQSSAWLTGTPLFLAPEVLNGGHATVQSDLYSMGVLLFRLVTQQYPVAGSTLEEVRSVHRTGHRRHLADVRSDLPPAFVSVIEQALAALPGDRPRSAGQLAQQLRAAAGATKPAPMRLALWLVLAAAAMVLSMTWRTSPLTERPTGVDSSYTLAVLPFELVGDSGQEYLSRAVSIVLSDQLATMGGLRVVPWSTARDLKIRGAGETGRDSHQIDFLVEGEVLLPEPTPSTYAQRPPLSVTVRVVRASTGTTIWSRSRSAGFGELIDVAQTLARQLANGVGVRLLDSHRQMSSYQPADRAMEEYMRGLDALIASRAAAEFRSAVDHFARATELDPRFAAAFVGLAQSRVLMSGYWGAANSASAYPQALAAAQTALKLDARSAEAWAIQGYVDYVLGWKWSDAERSFRQAIQLSASSPEVQSWYSDFLTATGRHDDAIAAALIAKDRAPQSATYSRRAAWAYFFKRDYAAAIRFSQQALQEDPGFAPAITLLARSVSLQGRPAEAVRLLEPLGQAQFAGTYDALIAQAAALAGDARRAQLLLKESVLTGSRSPVRPYLVAQVYAALGQTEDALEWLARSVAQREASAVVFGVDPHFDSIRQTKRFAELVEQAGLPTTVRR